MSSFQHTLRGIKGPREDSDLLAFLAAYLRTSAGELLPVPHVLQLGCHTNPSFTSGTAPHPVPAAEDLSKPGPRAGDRAEVARVVAEVSRGGQAEQPFGRIGPASNERAATDRAAGQRVFRHQPRREAALIEDTDPGDHPESAARQKSARGWSPCSRPGPTRCVAYKRPGVRDAERLGRRSGRYWRPRPRRGVARPGRWGSGVREGGPRPRSAEPMAAIDGGLLRTLDAVRTAIPQDIGHPRHRPRGDGVRRPAALRRQANRPKRYWTRTAAMNDADEIAGTILMRSPPGDA